MNDPLQRALAALIALAAGANEAHAEIKDYEVLRLLYLRSACGMASITSRDTSPEKVRFKADCQNKTAFPDGAEVVCTDHHDDRSCTVETKHRNFHSLELIKPSR